ncbi:MAG: alpha/beta hydrolase-fold protein [Acidobacteriota bacterium]
MKKLAAVLALSVLCPPLSASLAGEGSGTSAAPLSIGETFAIPSKILHETRRINVYLPPGYDAAKDARFPVLYMPDGGMGEDFLHVAGLVQVSVGNGTMRPFVLVGIENTERRRDMTGPTEDPEDRKIAPHVGGSAAFREFIAKELMPDVRARYRTTDETGIVGESLAGLFVVETFFLAPGMFDTSIAFDPSLWWNHQALVSSAPGRLKEYKGKGTLFLATSDEKGIVKPTEQLVEALKQNASADLRWIYEPTPAEGHGTIYHPAALKAFRALFKPAPKSP